MTSVSGQALHLGHELAVVTLALLQHNLPQKNVALLSLLLGACSLAPPCLSL